MPGDSFTQVCVSLAHQQDVLLVLVQRVCRAAQTYGDDKLVDDLTTIVQALNGHTTDIQETLRAIIEEQPPLGTGPLHG